MGLSNHKSLDTDKNGNGTLAKLVCSLFLLGKKSPPKGYKVTIYFNLHVNICCASCVLRSNSTPNLSSSQTLESSELAYDSVR